MAAAVEPTYAQRHDPLPIYPSALARVTTNPPVFSWPSDASGAYLVELADSTGRVGFKTTNNWLILDHKLSSGEYRWRYRPVGASDGKKEGWNQFTISSGLIELPIPSVELLLNRAKNRDHPRTIDLASSRENGVTYRVVAKALLPKIQAWSVESLPIEPTLSPSQSLQWKEQPSQMMATQKWVFDEEDKILRAALAWFATGNRMALDEARRRALNLAGLDSRGGTSFAAHDQAGRSIAWTLALTYDWLYPEFSATERRSLVTAISDRLTEMMGHGTFGLRGGRLLDTNPFDSHGAVTLGRVSVICTVMAGVAPQFDACFRNTVLRYLMWPVPWGRDDGGYANGTNYAQWDTAYTHFLVWGMLKESIGLDVATMPWAQGYGKFITYFLPPGTPTGLFGDGAEKNWRNVWATQARAYAARVPSPLADWYVRNQFGEDETSLPVLLAPYRDWSTVEKEIPAGTPDALHVRSIGWVAMHSSLADRGRTSVYFKSSPYGSFSHSHADQNGFVINAAGQPLAIDSGYYDYYDSPHWRGWYKQTRAHNAITFDGGQGQLHDTMAAKGKITQFETTPSFDLVTGDATQAYGGALTRAVRSMVYARPGTLLVFDSLVSSTPRTWEWNLHALKPMKLKGKRLVEIEQGGERLCIEVLHGPEVDFSQADQFTAPPSGAYAAQSHGTFRTADKSKELRMLTMLSVNCEGPTPEMKDDQGQLGVALGGHRFVFSNSGVEYVQ